MGSDHDRLHHRYLTSNEMVAATVHTIFAQATSAETTAQLREVVTILERQFPKAAETLAAAEIDVCAAATFPRAHWRKIASTNPLERITKEIPVLERTSPAGGDALSMVGDRVGGLTRNLSRRPSWSVQLSIIYDHHARRAKLQASPDPEVWSSARVGGGT